MKKSTYLYVLGLAIIIVAGLVVAAFDVTAQNSNSSMMSSNSNTATKKKPRKTRMSAGNSETPKKTGRCDPNQQEQTDLSGTYTGKLKHDDNAAEDATLTITGNNFTVNSGTDTHSGRISAVTTCGYTAVTMMMGDMTPPAPGATPPPPQMAVSLRAKKVGDNLTLMSVPGEPHKISFTTNGASKPAVKHRPKKKKATPKPPSPPQP